MSFGASLNHNDVVRCEPRRGNDTAFDSVRSPVPAITISAPAGAARLEGGNAIGGTFQ